MKTSKPFLILVFIFLAFTPVFAQAENYGLVVRGKVADLEVEKSKDAVLFYVKLDVEFINEGTEPLILFKPDVNNRYWLGSWSLYLTQKDAKSGKDIFGDGYWQSVSSSESYRKLAERLDVKIPPSDYTKTLQPKESWTFSDDFRIYFEAEKRTRFPEHKTWREMHVFPSKLWLGITYELSPWNVEYFEPNLIRKLQKRWKQFGNVLVEEKKEGRFNHFHIESEPMFVDFGLAKTKEISLRN